VTGRRPARVLAAALLTACVSTPDVGRQTEYGHAVAEAKERFRLADRYFYTSVLGLTLTSADAYVWMEIKLLPEQRRRLQDMALEGAAFAEEAIRLAPDRVEGHAYRALNLALVGVAKGATGSVLHGLPGTVQSSFDEALAIDRTWGNGALLRLKARFLTLAAWPYRDREQAQRVLEEANGIAPTPEGGLFLGDVFHLEDKPADAIAAWRAAQRAPADRSGTGVDDAIRELARRRLDMVGATAHHG